MRTHSSCSRSHAAGSQMDRNNSSFKSYNRFWGGMSESRTTGSKRNDGRIWVNKLSPRQKNPKNYHERNINSSRENNLKTKICNLYGEETHGRIRTFENLRRKKAKLLCDLTFLCRCRDNKIVPKSLKITHHIKTKAAERIYKRTGLALVREQIHSTRRSLNSVSERLYEQHLILSKTLDVETWSLVDTMTMRSAENYGEKAKNIQTRKFEGLYKRPEAPQLDINKVVVNLSDTILTTEAKSVLAKGGNFAVTPTSIPTEEIITRVEAAIYKLPKKEADEIRVETCRLLKRAKPPKCNISKGEQRALIELRKNKQLIILPADKGNATVVMNSADYETKIKDLLSADNYSIRKRDPTIFLEKKTKQLLTESGWEETVIKKLSPSGSLPPRLYGLPKIHKANVPLRPIVSAIGSPTYHLAQHLTTLLNPLVGNTQHHIRNSTHFIETIDKIHVSPSDCLVSFDVESLFTKVPIKDTIELLEPHFSSKEIALFSHCLTSSYFSWNKTFYEQKDGVAMGSPLSPVVANFFMESFEKSALDTAPLKPKLWLRYVDDTFVIWSHGRNELERFLNHLNSRHPNIKFTMETELEGKLPFLDVLVIKKPTGELGHTVYRKATHTDRYLNANSNHHPAQKRTVIKTLLNRANKIAEPEYLGQELDHLKTVLVANGYDMSEINRVTRPRNTRMASTLSSESQNTQNNTQEHKAYLPYIQNTTDRISKLLKKKGILTTFLPTKKISQQLRSAKDPRDPLLTPGIYKIPCTCGTVYVGMTDRSVQIRKVEHQRHVRLGHKEKSSIADHAITEGHTILFDDTEVLARTKGYYNLARREAIEIEQHPNNMNKDNGLGISRIWNPVLKNKQSQPGTRPRVTQPDGPVIDRAGNLPECSGHASVPAPAGDQGYKITTRSRSRQLLLNSHRDLSGSLTDDGNSKVCRNV